MRNINRVRNSLERGPIRTESGITIHLMGGMGNQMFQYAMGYANAKRLGVPLKLHTGSFDTDSMRCYSLGLWKGVTEPLVKQYSGPVINEIGMPYNQTIIPNHCTLHGYWQTEKYFLDVRPDLLERFQPKQPLSDTTKQMADKIFVAGCGSIFLTVRRTDYTHTDYHGVLSMDYYREALRIIIESADGTGMSDSKPHVFVFSDEPEWCDVHFKIDYPMTIAGTFNRTWGNKLGREDEDLWLMSLCNHAVMANSSYSWWGAWLNTRGHNSVVVAPKKWFNNSPEDPRDIVPDRWIKI